MESETNSAVLSASSGQHSTASSCCQLPSSEGITVFASPPAAPAPAAPAALSVTDQPPAPLPPPQSSSPGLLPECRQASIDSVRFSVSLSEQRCNGQSISSTTTAAANGGGANSAAPHDITPEIAHRIRHLQVIRVRDRKTVVMESLWNLTVPEEPPTPQAETSPMPPDDDASTNTPMDGGAGGSRSIPPKTPSKNTKGAKGGRDDASSGGVPMRRRLPLLYNETDVCADAPIVATERGRPALVCLFRRWGCCICRMTAASLSALMPFLTPRGIRLVGIGYEEVGLKKFIAAGHFAGELYLDPTRALYQTVECRTVNWRSLWGILGSDSTVPSLIEKAMDRSFKYNFEGDFSQFGGVFLIDANGVTRYLQIQTKQNFHIDTLRILSTIGVTPPDDFDPLPNAYTTTW